MPPEIGVGLLHASSLVSAAARALGFVCTTPMLGLDENRIRVRVVLAVLLALVLLPGDSGAGFSADWTELAVRAILDLAAGALVGLLLRCLVGVAVLVAQLVEYQIGLQPAPDADDEGAATALGRFYQLSAVTMFFALGVHRLVVAGLLDSAAALPANWSIRELSNQATGLVVVQFSLAVRLAAPVVLSLVTTNLAMGVIARVMPQFAGPGVSTPLQIAVGLVLVLLGLAATCTGLVDQSEYLLRAFQSGR